MTHAPSMLPLLPNLNHLRKEAKARLATMRIQNPSARLAQAQHALAAGYGFAGWAALKQAVETGGGALPRGQRTAQGLRDLERWRFSAPDADELVHAGFRRAGLLAALGFAVIALVGVAMVMMAGRAAAAEANDLQAYAGSFQITPHLVAHIRPNGDHLIIRLTGQPERNLVPRSADDFTVGDTQAEIAFARDSQGQISSLNVRQAGRVLAAPRISETAATAIEALPPLPKGHPIARTWPVMAKRPVHIITDDSALDYWPCFSPDGKSVLFSRSQDGGKHWMLLRMAVGGGVPISMAGGADLSATRAAWSRSGVIAFTGTDPQGHDRLWTLQHDGTGAAVVPGSDGLVYPSWSGADLVAMDTTTLALRHIDLAGNAEPLTDPAQVLTGMPSVSPDGTGIAFAGQKNAGQPYNQEENVVWVMTPGGVPTPLETPPLQGRAPIWSPDGETLAFESDRGSPDGHYAVFLIHRDGTGLTQVTDYALDATHPVFSPDGRHLVLAVGDPAQHASHIAIVDLP